MPNPTELQETEFELIHQEDYENYAEIEDHEKSFLSLSELKEHILEMGREYEYEIGDNGEWQEFIKDGLTGFKEDGGELSENTIFALATSVLSVQSTDVYRFIDKENNVQERITMCKQTPDSKFDNAQVLYQLGFGGSYISEMFIYVGSKHVAIYGSRIVGTQSVRYYQDENGKYFPAGEGEEKNLVKNPSLMMELSDLGKKKDSEFLFYDNGCWIMPFYEDVNNNDLSEYSESVVGYLDSVENSISEGMGISLSVVRELEAATKLSLDAVVA